MFNGQSFFHRCHSIGLEDISLFFLDLLPYSHEDVGKGDFYGAIFHVIVAVLLCCRELRTCINFHINFFLRGAKLRRTDCSMQSHPLKV